jgi:DUF2914 family protein
MAGLRNRLRQWTDSIRRYERHLSAAGMVLGYIIDSLTFGRIDRPRAHLIFAAYLFVAATTIVIAHGLQTRADRKATRQAVDRPSGGAAPTAPIAATEKLPDDAAPMPIARWRTWLPAMTQFALGGLWSGFLVFYSRSASLTASWLFLAVLIAFLVGNEVFRRYHSRLVFACLLFFFAAYSYAVFLLPVVTRTIGRLTFIASGGAAIVLFLILLQLLARVGPERYRQSRLPILGGAIAITLAMNLFYFTGVLPPLPLALLRAGVYHTIKHQGDLYIASTEPEPWYLPYTWYAPILHVPAGQPLSLYSAIFAPIQLTTRITHVWERYDPRRGQWSTQSRVTFSISGGRDGGYRAYTVKSNPRPGNWRVDIESEDGRLIGRIRFDVVPAAEAPDLRTMDLK